MKEAPISIFRNRLNGLNNGQPDLGPGSNEAQASGDIPTQAAPESEIDKRKRRLQRLQRNWTAKPPGTGEENVGSKDYLFDGRYRHPRSKKKPDIPEV